MNDCPTFEELSSFVDGEVSEEEGLRLQAHLERCDVCAGELEQLRALGTALRAIPSASGDTAWMGAWRGRLDEGHRWAHWRGYRMMGAATAAVLFVASLAMIMAGDRFVPSTALTRHVQASGIVYEVSTDKTRYDWGEPVFVQVKMTGLDQWRATALPQQPPRWWLTVARDSVPVWDSRRHLSLAQRDLAATLEPGRSRGMSTVWDQEDDSGRPVPVGQYDVVIMMGDPPTELTRIAVDVQSGGE